MSKVDELLKSKGFVKTETKVYTDGKLSESTLEYKFTKKCRNKIATWYTRSIILFDLLEKTFSIVENASENEHISQIELHKLIDMKLKELGWIE